MNCKSTVKPFIRVIATLLFCHFGPVFAEIELKPTHAEYRIVVSGIPVGIKANIDLTPLSEDVSEQFELLFSVKNTVLKHREYSRFSWRDCQSTPSHYAYQSKGFGISRGGEVDFDWPKQQATGSKIGLYDLDLNTVDALSLAMMARCVLARGETEFHFSVAEADGKTDFNFKVVGHEKLETPAGTYDTIKVERVYGHKGKKTFMWSAPELDYFMIRMEHIENAVIRGRLEMTDIQMETAPTTMGSDAVESDPAS